MGDASPLLLRVCFVCQRGIICNDESLKATSNKLILEGFLEERSGRIFITQKGITQIGIEDGGGLNMMRKGVKAFRTAKDWQKTGKILAPSTLVEKLR